MNLEEVRRLYTDVLGNVQRVIVGQEEVFTLLFTAVLSRGHVLLEDTPGTGKTSLAKAFAKSVNGSFHRVQFTPDLLPQDITGLSVYDQKEQEFRLMKGPVFTNLLLADEINRATPRTQSALLEAMEERHVTIDGETLPLEKPFLVIATENPIETTGTYPLPEAQLDRFLIRLSMDKLEKDEEWKPLEDQLRDYFKKVIAKVDQKDKQENQNAYRLKRGEFITGSKWQKGKPAKKISAEDYSFAGLFRGEGLLGTQEIEELIWFCCASWTEWEL